MHEIVEKIRTAIYKIGKREEEIGVLETLLREDKDGSAYKCFFDTENEATSWDNPKGNNLLLLAIATAIVGFVTDKDGKNIDNKGIATQLANIILEDAETKLTEEEFRKFIDFRYGNGDPEKYNNYSIYFDNTPLTLCMKCGLLLLAEELVELGAKVNVSCGYAKFSPLHLAILHYVVKPDPLIKDLILKLINKGADMAAKDEYGHTAKDLLQYKGLGVEDLHLFTINNKILKEAIKPKDGQKYSFKELAANKYVVEFLENKGFTTFEANWTNTNLFRKFLKDDQKYNRDILDNNGIVYGNGLTEDNFADVVIRTLSLNSDGEIRKLVQGFSEILYGGYNLEEAIKAAPISDSLHRSFVNIFSNPDPDVIESAGKFNDLLLMGEITVY